MLIQKPSNDVLTTACKEYSTFSFAEIREIEQVYALISPAEDELDFKILLSAFTLLYTMIMILMLERTQNLGQLIIMAD